MKAKKKPAAEFDISEFLRPTDADLKSAIRSLIGSQEDALVPIVTDIKLGPGIEIVPGPNLVPGSPSLPSLPKSVPEVNLRPAPKITPDPNSGPSIVLDPAPVRRKFAIRRALNAADGHNRTEQTVYEALWREGESDADGTRLVRIGMLTLARIVGLSESNARLNLRSLIRKLAIDEFSSYVCEQGQGRTWRVYSPELILSRREAAGLTWIMKRTLAVVFVDPHTGQDCLT